MKRCVIGAAAVIGFSLTLRLVTGQPAVTPLLAQGKGLTAVEGIRVGHHTLTERPTGCTVILVEKGATGGVAVRGSAPGTRETDLLDPSNLVEQVHAIVFSGGSAFGLDAASGVMKYLEERKVGFPFGGAYVPIVPAAVLFDLPVGGKPLIRPDASCGYAAARAATDGPVAEGSVGAGAGATVGKFGGGGNAMKGGIGTASITLPSGLTVAALVAVNAAGDIIDPSSGRVVAGARGKDGVSFLDARTLLRTGTTAAQRPGENTTLGLIATNARITKAQARKIAEMAHDGYARAISPAHTMNDGDTIFAIGTGAYTGDANITILGGLAAETMADAILRAVREATGLPNYPAVRDLTPQVNIYVALLIGYSAALTALGLWIARKVRGPADFFVAGRKLTWPYIAATMLAANIGAGATVGATGLAYQQGASAWFWNASAGIGSLLLATIVGPRIWKLAAERNYLTVGDFLEDRYGQSVRVIIASLIWFGALFILAGQLLLGAAVFAVVAGLPKWAGVLIGGAAMTGYFSAGGLLSSVGVSVVQLVVKFTGFAIAIPILLSAAGGLDAIAHTPGLPDTFFDPWFSAGANSGFTLLLLSGPNFIVSPGLIQKTYGAESARAVKLGVGANAIALLIFAFLPVFLGLAARVLFPGIEAGDQVLPTLLLHGLPVWLGALALAAVFSAEVGACEAILFMLSTSLSQDLYKRIVNPNATPAQVLKVARVAALIGGSAGMLLAVFVVGEIIDALSVFYSIIGATLLVPVVGGLFVRSATSRDALASIATGMIAFLAIRYGTDRSGWLNPNLWGLIASAAGFFASLAVSRLSGRQLPAA